MNFLAHLALAQNTPASRIGNLLGDFAKGTIQSLSTIYPPEIINGIITHRAIDRFTDSHPAFHEAKQLLAPQRRRFAGIIVDIIYDHYLSLHWNTYHQGNLTTFIQNCYTDLQEHPQWLPPNLTKALPHMIQQNWLACYATQSGINLTFRRVSQRGKHTAPIAQAIQDLTNHQSAFQKNFQTFYPELQTFTKSLPNNT